jgi:hypothetical protein
LDISFFKRTPREKKIKKIKKKLENRNLVEKEPRKKKNRKRKVGTKFFIRSEEII